MSNKALCDFQSSISLYDFKKYMMSTRNSFLSNADISEYRIVMIRIFSSVNLSALVVVMLTACTPQSQIDSSELRKRRRSSRSGSRR